MAIVSFVVYAPSIGYQFVWDDEYFVVRNRALQSWRNVPLYFTDIRTYAQGIEAPMYRPLRNISYLLDYTVAGGLRPAWFHAHNVVLHMLNVCLVLWLLLVFRGAASRRSPSGLPGTHIVLCALAALLWAGHPSATEVVAWVKSRDDLLFTAYYLLAIIVLVSGLARGRLSPGRIAAISLLYSLSLLSKEMAVSLPLVAAVLCAYLGRETPRREKILATATTVALTLLFVVVRHAVIGKTQQQGYIAGSFYYEMLTMTRAAARYVRLVVFPSGLLADYRAFGVSHSPLEWRVIMSCVLVAALVVICIGSRKKWPAVSLGLAWFGITLLPVSNVVSTMQFFADRFLYLPLVGIAILAADVLIRMSVQPSTDSSQAAASTPLRSAAVPIAIATALLGIFLVATSLRLPVWRNNLALYERTYLDSPPSGRIAHNYASALANAGRYDEAVPIFRKLVESGDPALADADRARIEEGYGLSLMATGKLDEGLSHSLAALAMRPDNPDVLGHIGFYYGSKGNHRKAFEYYDRSFRMNPGNLQVKQNRERALASLKAAESDKQTSQSILTSAADSDQATTSQAEIR